MSTEQLESYSPFEFSIISTSHKSHIYVGNKELQDKMLMICSSPLSILRLGLKLEYLNLTIPTVLPQSGKLK